MATFCQLCGVQSGEVAENWSEVKEIVKIIFKTDLIPYESVANCLGVCSACNERLRCCREFYEMIMVGQEQLKTSDVIPTVSLRRSSRLIQDSGSVVEVKPSISFIRASRFSGSAVGNTPPKLERHQSIKLTKDCVDNHCKLIHSPKAGPSHGSQKSLKVIVKRLSYQSKEEKEVSKMYECNACSRKFTTDVLLMQHLEKVHIQPKPKIDKSTISGPKVQCKICNRLLLHEVSLKRHMKNIHLDKGPHICDICHKESKTNQALKQHKRNMHQNVRKYSCSYCEKTYKAERYLKEHMTAVHLGEALFGCQFCEKTFNSSSNLYSHRKSKHPEEYKKLQEAKYGK